MGCMEHIYGKIVALLAIFLTGLIVTGLKTDVELEMT